MSFLARDVVVATGATTTFSVPFSYLSKDDVKVYLDDEPVGFTFLNDTLISISPAPSGTVRIQRETPYVDRLVDFTDTANLSADDLDRSALQVFYLAQELADRTTDTESDIQKLVTDIGSFQSQLDTQSLHLSALDSAVTEHYQQLQAQEVAFGLLQNTVTQLQANLTANYYTRTAVYTKSEVDSLIAAIPTGGSGGEGTVGPAGKSAYQLAVDQGFAGAVSDWLLSLKGAAGRDGTDGAPGRDGTNGTNGTDGTPGADGRSAYQVAVANGYVGTESQWLASLKGADGTSSTGGSGAPLTHVKVFPDAGTFSWTVPANTYVIQTRGYGGGGAGSNAPGPDGSGNYTKGAGGGGGACSEYVINVTPGDVLSITIGDGGTSPGSGSSQGGNGGTTSLSKSGYWAVSIAGGQHATNLQPGYGGQANWADVGASAAYGVCIFTCKGQDGQEALLTASSTEADAPYYSGQGGAAGGGGGAGGQGRRSVSHSSGDVGYSGCIPGGGGGGGDEAGRGGPGAQGLLTIRF